MNNYSRKNIVNFYNTNIGRSDVCCCFVITRYNKENKLI